jgi:hypothetical protein
MNSESNKAEGKRLHKESLKLYKQALKTKNNHTLANELFRKAFSLECDAIKLTDEIPLKQFFQKQAVELSIHGKLYEEGKEIVKEISFEGMPSYYIQDIKDLEKEIDNFIGGI